MVHWKVGWREQGIGEIVRLLDDGEYLVVLLTGRMEDGADEKYTLY